MTTHIDHTEPLPSTLPDQRLRSDRSLYTGRQDPEAADNDSVPTTTTTKTAAGNVTVQLESPSVRVRTKHERPPEKAHLDLIVRFRRRHINSMNQ